MHGESNKSRQWYVDHELLSLPYTLQRAEFGYKKSFPNQYWSVSTESLEYEYGKSKERWRLKYVRERGIAKQTFLTRCLSNLIKIFVRCYGEHLKVKA